MIKRKELKKTAKATIKHHYFRNVLLVFICSLLLAGGFNYTTKNIQEIDIHDKKVNQILNNKSLTSSEILGELLEKTTQEKKLERMIENKYTNGVLSYLINDLISSKSIIFSFLNSANKIFFHNKIGLGVVVFISSILISLFSILFINAIEVGKCRYFLEQRRYYGTKIDRVLFPYLMKKTFHLAYILFIRSIYQFLFNLTIIGGFIKYYEYFFVPYILAENPNIKKKDAFLLSKELSNGCKWELFCLDLSMLGWDILRVFTLNLSAVFYSDLYKEALYAEVYMSLRKEKFSTLSHSELLNDEYLAIDIPKEESYPEEKFSIPVSKMNKALHLNYDRDYGIKSYILFFFTFSIIGFLWEVLLHLISDGCFVNRGTMHGPWLPIYGCGGVLILILLKRYRDKPFSLFLATFLLCGVVEYGTAWFLETFRHLKYWDYTGYFLNIHGRVCLEGLLVFGLGGCGFTYIIAPILDNFYQQFNHKLTTALCIVLLFSFSVDFIYSSFFPNTGEGITKEIYMNHNID